MRFLVVPFTAAAAAMLVPSSAARAGLVLSQLVVELVPGDRTRADLEVWNEGAERSFVSIEPREIIAPGTPSESRRSDPDPEKLGLLVSPSRMILEPGQRKLLRIASLAGGDRERVYRVTVKPVAGQLSAPTSGLKLLVGYDALVLSRPSNMRMHVTGSRFGDTLTLRNDGNVSVELVDGKACDAAGKLCEDLPGGRLYAGAEKKVSASGGRQVRYSARFAGKLLPLEF